MDFRVYRSIWSGPGDEDILWLVVGDSMRLRLGETKCSFDMCTPHRQSLEDSGWSIADSRIARLQHPVRLADSMSLDGFYGPTRYFLKAVRPGRTVVRARGVTGSLDAAVQWRGPAGVVEREILVTPPVARLQIVSAPDTVRVHEPFVIRAHALDKAGSVLEGVPIVFLPEPSEDRTQYVYGSAVPVRLFRGGPSRIIARLREFADTVTVMVVDSADYRRPR
jgi:hypothetical protein